MIRGTWQNAEQQLMARRSPQDLLAKMDAVRPILDDIRERGDDAVRAWSAKFGDQTPATMRVAESELQDAWDSLTDQTRADLRLCHERIRRFHASQLPTDLQLDDPVASMGRRIVPVPRAGAYVPGGRASYPSSVLMNLIPATVAGVPSIAVCTPPGPDGAVPAITRAALHLCGVTEVYAIGGAQAILAMAIGTESIPKVDRLCGPGNAYVAAAKALVSGWCPVDALAGPSEILLLTDNTSDPEFVAGEMVAQAEHDPDAQCIVLGTDVALLELVADAISRRAAKTPRAEIVSAALTQAAVLRCSDDAEMLAACDVWAPEHLSIQTADPEAMLAELQNYGGAFLGRSPVALGDYATGPNHTLPTGGMARSHSGLNVAHFLRYPTHQTVHTPDAQLLAAAARLAHIEGLHAHAQTLEELQR